MEEGMKENGKTTKWKDKEYSRGLTTGDTKENTSMTKKKAMVCSTGLMEESTKENGRMVNNMALEYTHQQVAKPVKVSGWRGREWLGCE